MSDSANNTKAPIMRYFIIVFLITGILLATDTNLTIESKEAAKTDEQLIQELKERIAYEKKQQKQLSKAIAIRDKDIKRINSFLDKLIQEYKDILARYQTCACRKCF